MPTEEWVGKSGLNPYADWVMQTDHAIGQVLDALDRNGIAGNTLVVFASDNGCAPEADFVFLQQRGHQPSYHFRGHKADIYEGGHRIPLLMRYPKEITAGAVCQRTVCLTDFMATCADIIGTPLPDHAGVDSFSLRPLFMGQGAYGRDTTVHHSIIGERDNHEMLPINTVTNAFHAHALNLMSRIAETLEMVDDATAFAERASRVTDRINELLYDAENGVYVDGEGSRHSSLHSNMFMLAFGLVPCDRKGGVVEFVKSRGMACSVYGAQHLLDALYLNGEAEHALELMTATHDRSWWNMIQAGSTMTLEAWDIKYKKNLDWNHAWGAAPANIIPRYVAGVRPVEPGFKRTVIQPQPGTLTSFDAKVPTPLGPVTVKYDHGVALEITAPDAMEVDVQAPAAFTGEVRLKRTHVVV